MVTTIDLLRWSSLTAAVNEIRSPNNFWLNLLFTNIETLPTEDIELSSWVGPRKMAPFVKKNGEGVLMSGPTTAFATVAAPNIRLKNPFNASELMFNRRPGTTIFVGGDTVFQQAQQKIAKDLAYTNDSIVNTEEWMAAQAVTGTISYTTGLDPTEGDVFTITFPKSAGNTVALTGTDVWSNAAGNPVLDFLRAKRRLELIGLQPDIAVFSPEAHDSFINNVAVAKFLDSLNITAGQMTTEGKFNDQGVIPIGRFCGIPCVEYGRTVLDPGGTTRSMVRSKYVEFVCTRSSAENKLFYGAIADIKALQGKLFQGRRFAKSWEVEDPSALMHLVAARPLPVCQRPDSIYSLKVEV